MCLVVHGLVLGDLVREVRLQQPDGHCLLEVGLVGGESRPRHTLLRRKRSLRARQARAQPPGFLRSNFQLLHHRRKETLEADRVPLLLEHTAGGFL